MSAGRAMHHTWDVRVSRCCRRSQVSEAFAHQVAVLNVHSGIMRITVTVVVIMFELTGALTYILPTMVGKLPCR